MNPGTWLTIATGVAATGDVESGRQISTAALAGELAGLQMLQLFGYVPPGTAAAAAPLIEIERQVGGRVLEAAADVGDAVKSIGKALFPP